MRQRLLAQTGSESLVARVAPRQPGEAEAAARARLLMAATARALDMKRLPSLRVHTPPGGALLLRVHVVFAAAALALPLHWAGT